MKGYYKLRIRRAATGAMREYSFHNHIMPDFYEILMAKSVNDNNNSVIDTLVFGDGIGSHAADATVLNGSIVYEKKYNDYNPPLNLSAAQASTEFAHELHFNAFNTGEILRIGEVAIGARVNGDFKIASLTHIKDANGDPTTLILMPGDEIDVVWTFIVARPLFLPGYETTPLDYLVSNIYSYSNTNRYAIDYEMLTAYPNWHLMGLKRILSLIANRNSLVTKTTWHYQKYNQGSSLWEEIEPTVALLRSGGLRLFTDSADPLYEVPKDLFVPNLLAPVKLSWVQNDAVFGNSFTLKLTLNDLYTRWEASYRTPDSAITEPKVVTMLDVTYTSNATNYETKIQTTPYVLVTVYKNGLVKHNLLADEFGVCRYTVPRKGLLDTDEYLVRAHVNGHQLKQTINYPVPTVEVDNLITCANYVTNGTQQYAPHAVMFSIAPSIVGKTYKVTGASTLVEGARSYTPAIDANSTVFGDITRTLSWTGDFKIGDKFTISIRDNVTNAIVQTVQFEVRQLLGTNMRNTKQTPSDQLFLKVKAYNVTV